MKYKQGLIFLILCHFFISGCGFKDLDKRFFVTAIGVDKTESKEKPWKVTLKLVIPSAKIEPGKESYQIVQEESDTISDAIRRMKSKVDKEFDFGHTKIIVLGEDIVKEDIPSVIDWFERRRDIQEIAYVMVGKPSAQQVLEIKPKSERLPSNALILSFGQVGTESPYIVTEYLFDFYRRIKEKGLDPLLPVVKALEKEQSYEIDTVALFDKKGLKLVLTPEESRTLNEFMFKLPKFDVHVKTNEEQFVMSVEGTKAKYKISTSPNGKPNIDVTVSLTGIIEESRKDIAKDQFRKYEKYVEETAEKKLLNLLKKVQASNVDPVGFGLHYMATVAKDKNGLEEWKEIYPNVQFRIKTKAEIKDPGKIY